MTRNRVVPWFVYWTALLAGTAYFLLKGLGLLADVGDSRLNRHPTFSLQLRPVPLILAGLLLLLGILAYRARESLVRGFENLAERWASRTMAGAVGVGLASLLLMLPLFVPFRYNEVRIPSAKHPGMEIRGHHGRLELEKAEKGYEDYTRNYVVARAVRELGPSAYFDLARSPSLTGPERSLCQWGLRRHPPGYHFLLAPFTSGPAVARALSLILYSLTAALAYLLLASLFSPASALLGTVLFWSAPAYLFFLGMMTSNDLAVAPLILLGLVLLIRPLEPRATTTLLAGLVFGLAFCFKYTALLALPLALILMLYRQGPRRTLLLAPAGLLGFLLPVAAWIFVLSGTPWGSVQHQIYIERTLSRATDPSRIGQARSVARGTLLDFFAFLPAEWGPPATVAIAAALGWFAVGRDRFSRTALTLLAAFGVTLVAAVLTIPKTNYIFFAMPFLFGFAGFYLGHHPRRTAGLLTVLACFGYGVLRVVLYGIQTW